MAIMRVKQPDGTISDLLMGKSSNCVSPTISVAEITGGHRITIIDKDGPKYVDVMNGSNDLATDEEVEDMLNKIFGA